MNVEREMSAIEREIVTQNQVEHTPAPARDRLQAGPEKSVMNDEEIYAFRDGRLDGTHGSVHGRADFRDDAGVLDLKAVESVWPIVNFARPQMLICIGNNLAEARHARHCDRRDVLLHVPN